MHSGHVNLVLFVLAGSHHRLPSSVAFRLPLACSQLRPNAWHSRVPMRQQHRYVLHARHQQDVHVASSHSSSDALVPNSGGVPGAVFGIITAAVVSLTCCGPLLMPDSASAKARMTPDEQVTIDVFKRSTPSVVNVTNMAARQVRILGDVSSVKYVF